ncbi:E3 ubiquitin-protein ligase ubr1 [Sphaceloma murrayae]|uniref:E3 ubiquitin-protein ligase ubr1 n=1 Tax=Sphaceloma murrayae TaxID=2082308 RepID=A0A2K1QP94_9PEZI|nr:E3 ubiquitin-protein ligase ubr1 [Sphaceloma murrayae]
MSTIWRFVQGLFRQHTTEADTLSPRLDLNGAHEQIQSPLFRLPPEIRHQIFEELLGHQTIHVDTRDPSGFSNRSTGRDGSIRGRPCTHMLRRGVWRHPCWDTVSVDDKGLLPLLLSCRRLYGETAPILYGTTRFDLPSLNSMTALFVRLPRHHLDAVRSVRLFVNLLVPPGQGTTLYEPYTGMWRDLSTMEGLRELRVCIALAMQIDSIWEHRAAYFDPMKQIRHLSVFEVYIPPDTSQLPDGVVNYVPGCRIAGWDVWKR